MLRLSSLVLVMMSSPALAQDIPCELHVWPARATNSVTAGVLSNFGPIGAYADLESNRDATLHDQLALIETLTPPIQAQTMVSVDLPQLLGLGQVRLIFQGGNFEPRSVPKQRSRMSQSTAPCYAELIVSLNEFRKSAVRGRSLKTQLTFKDFRGGRVRIVTANEASAVRNFPAQTPEQAAQARQGISDAFAMNVRAFARRVTRGSR